MVQKYQNLAPKIIDLRKSLGEKTQESFSIAHWETARSEPSIDQILEMAAFKGDRSWWHVLYLLDDKVSHLDNIDYNKDGTRHHWLTQEEIAEMGNDPESEEYWEWKAKQEAAPPTEGPLSEALKLEPAKMVEAIESLLDQESPESNTINHGLGSIINYSNKQKEEEEKSRWDRRTKNFRSAVIHSLNKKLNSINIDKFMDVLFKKGTFKAKADYFDGVSLIQIVNEQVKFKNEALGRTLGKLLLLEKMHGSSLQKMLAICVDIDKPKVHYAMLDDISFARSIGITLTFVTPDDEEVLADEIVNFINNNMANKTSTPF